ncbi:hypothetical protein ABPG72_008281 [Tetrahymena utriculariae]
MNSKYYKQPPQKFEILAILDKRANPKNGKIEYLVQWKQWPLDNTWEPKKNIQNFIDQNELFVEDEDLRRHYKEKQYRRKILREERNNQVEKICSSLVSHTQISNTQSKQNDDVFLSSLDEYEEDIMYEDSFDESNFQENHKEFWSTNPNPQQPIKEFEQEIDRYSIKNIKLKKENFSLKTENNFQNSKKQIFSNSSAEVDLSQNAVSQKVYQANEYQLSQDNFKNDGFSEENVFENKSVSTEQIQFSNSSDRQKHQKMIRKVPSIVQFISKDEEIRDFKDEEIGDFIKDDISNIEMEIKYSFKVSWQKRSNGVIPLPKTIEVLSKKHISPQEMIDYLNQQHQINSDSNRNTQ